MFKKLALCLSFLFIISSCALYEKGKTVNLIIWGNFMNPQKTYESIVTDLNESGFIDSIRIVGLPLSENIIDIEIDSVKAKKLDVSISEITNKIKSITGTEGIKEFERLTIETLSKKHVVPISAITSIVLKLEPYKPELYLQNPPFYKYKDEFAVKIELFCKWENRSELEELIFTTMEKHSNCFIDQLWQFEIIKGKLPD